MRSPHKKKTFKYLDVYPDLPSKAPFGYPHIIDLKSLNSGRSDGAKLAVSDAVATILFNLVPGALTAFLDLDRPNFLFIQSDVSGIRQDFCIKRDGPTVGRLKSKDAGGWDYSGGWDYWSMYLITGKATEPWAPIFYGDNSFAIMDLDQLLQVESCRAYTILTHEGSIRAHSDRLFELICGLSHGRYL